MIPDTIVRYLRAAKAPFVRHWHARAVSAQELAASLGISGYRVGKTVVVEADSQFWLAVVPAPELVDEGRLARAIGAKRVRLVSEEEFGALFPECELGAEPPFGKLYALPVIVERTLAQQVKIAFRAGSHEETIEMSYADFARLESPAVAEFGYVYPSGHRQNGPRLMA